MTERKEYSAGAVKISFWFMEIRKVVGLLVAILLETYVLIIYTVCREFMSRKSVVCKI